MVTGPAALLSGWAAQRSRCLARISHTSFSANSDTRWPTLVIQHTIYILVDISYIFVFFCRITGAAQAEEMTTQGEVKHQVFLI